MKFFILLLLTFSGLLSFSQDEIFCSALIKSGRNSSRPAIPDTDSSGFYSFTSTDDKVPAIELVRHNLSSMKEEWRKRIDLPKMENCALSLNELIHFPTHFVLLTSGTDAITGNYKVFANIIANNGTLSGSQVLVFETHIQSASDIPEMNCCISPDRQKMLLLFTPPDNQKTSESISLKMYSADVELLWDKELELPCEKDMVRVQRFIVDNDGGVYMMSGKNPEKKSWQRPQGNLYVVFYYNNEANKLKEYDVSLKEKRVLSIQYDLNKNNELVIGGYYSNDYSFSVAGTFLFVISAGGETIRTASFMPFPKDFLLQFMNEKRAERNASLDDFFLDNLLLNDDSTCTLIGEQYYISEQMMTDISTGRMYVQTTYNFDDIIVTRVKPDGRIVWSVKVPKRQYSLTNNATLSYSSFIRDDSVLLFFNDHPSNIPESGEKPVDEIVAWNSPRKSVTTEVRIAADGTMTRRMVFQNDKKGALMIPMPHTENRKGQIILGYETGREYGFCRVP
ncbi:MAG: hypothetical protein IT223_10205 [Crocinitomicaceae bacterium]|nr:hypothetical protein [Crocinitomicaceae bacterium]